MQSAAPPPVPPCSAPRKPGRRRRSRPLDPRPSGRASAPGGGRLGDQRRQLRAGRSVARARGGGGEGVRSPRARGRVLARPGHGPGPLGPRSRRGGRGCAAACQRARRGARPGRCRRRRLSRAGIRRHPAGALRPLRSAPGTGGDAGRIGRRASRRRGDARPRRRRHGRPRTGARTPPAFRRAGRTDRQPPAGGVLALVRRSLPLPARGGRRRPSGTRALARHRPRDEMGRLRAVAGIVARRGRPRRRPVCPKGASASSTPGHWPPSSAIPAGREPPARASAGWRARKGGCPTGLRLLEEARRRAASFPDAYVWVEAYALAELAIAAVEAGHRRARQWVEDLISLTARTGMRELAVRAYLLRADLGDGSALESAADPRRRGREPGAPTSHPGPPRRRRRLIHAQPAEVR